MVFLTLMGFWLTLNGRITLEVVLFGLVLSGLISMLSYRLLRIDPSREVKIIRVFPKIFRYLLILIIEIVKANLEVVRIVLSKNPKLSPSFRRVKVDLKSNLSLVALANSITLTPGTITVYMDGKELLVHGLKKENLNGLENSVFVNELKEMEKKWTT